MRVQMKEIVRLELVERVDTQESAVTIGADGFSYTREGEAMPEYKLGNQL